MNRDWFAQTQPETRGRAALYLEFWPHVVVDLHEMGGESSYYFAPPADPINPLITKNQQKWFDAFGRANGAMFDARGFAYFIREVYDSFYPGYGESLADLPGRHRHDLRAGVGARAALPARGRRGAVVPRRRPAPLHRRDHDGRDRGEEPRRDPARLLRLPAQRGERR